MKKSILLLLLVSMACMQIFAQRYMSPIFSSVKVTPVIYGENYTVLAVPTLGKTVKQPLVGKVYTPDGDTETNRPLVIYLHTGNFLPQSVTQSPNGNLDDSCAIEICTRLAKMGYVAVSADYRLGWNPVAPTQEERTNTLINAAYRGLQDTRTCVRYFKKNAGTFGVDTTKVVVWGQGTGGYVALAVATLSSYTEVLTTTNPAGKFFKADGTPMVIWKLPSTHPQLPNFVINGDIEGKDLGLVPPGTVGPPKGGDTLCLPNHVNQNSDIQMCVNMGGALGDLSWIDAKTPPTISFQVPWDPFAPYMSAVLRVPVSPTVSLPVVEVQGAFTTQQRMDSLGINNVFDKILPAYDPYKALATTRSGGKFIRGLFPLYGDNATDSSPWDFWSMDTLQNKYAFNGLASNPTMSPAKAKRYIDTMMTFYIPRACVALNLPCKGTVTSFNELITDSDNLVTIAPNPAMNVTRINANNETIKDVQLYDINGRMIKVYDVNNTIFDLYRTGDISAGMYFVGVRLEKGTVFKKLMFN